MRISKGVWIGAGIVVAAFVATTLRLNSHGAADGGSGWLAGNGKPVQLALSFDAAHGRARVIGPSGGSVSATGADGTRYDLRIPEGALLAPEKISLIPITNVGRLPLHGGSVAAVHLKPDGLRLFVPARLRITPKKSVPVAEQVAFAYFGNGHDAHMYPVGTDPKRIELPIFHFSGYGFGQAAPNDPGRLALQQATDKEARMQARVAAAINEERQNILFGKDEQSHLWQIVGPILKQYYQEVVQPLMQTAETDERMAECAIQRYLGWQRQVQLLGLNGDAEIAKQSASAHASFVRIFQNAAEKRYKGALQRCKEEQDFNALAEILVREREAQLMGIDTKRNFGDFIEDYEKCMTFEVEFRSIIENKTPSGGTYHHVASKVQVIMSPFEMKQSTGPLQYVAYRASGNPTHDVFGKGVNTPVGNILEEGSATISPAGTRGDTLRVFKIGWVDTNVKMKQTNCTGQDEEQMRIVADTFSITFRPGVPTELLRFNPVHAGETTTLGKGIAAWMQAMGNSAEANRARKELAIGGAFTSEERRWAEGWARNHAELETSSATGSSAGTLDDIGGTYTIRLKPVTKGVWRADFKSETAPQYGFSKSETSYLILRHTPR